MNFKPQFLALAIFSGILNVGNASEYLGSFKSGTYTSPEKSLVCSLPILNSSEEYTENYYPNNEGISVLLNGDVMLFSRTSFSAEQAKDVEKSMTLKEKLLALETYWNTHFVSLMDSSETKKEFLVLDKTVYRLFITSGVIEGRAMGTTAQLYTIDGSNIISYLIRNLDKTPHDMMEKSLMSVFEKCKYIPRT